MQLDRREIEEVRASADLVAIVGRRAPRTFIVRSCEQVDKITPLPSRVTVDEWKDYGLVNIEHAAEDKRSIPWLAAGLYRAVGPDGKLYFIEVGSVVRGKKSAAWIFRPILRVGSGKLPND